MLTDKVAGRVFIGREGWQVTAAPNAASVSSVKALMLPDTPCSKRPKNRSWIKSVQGQLTIRKLTKMELFIMPPAFTKLVPSSFQPAASAKCNIHAESAQKLAHAFQRKHTGGGRSLRHGRYYPDGEDLSRTSANFLGQSSLRHSRNPRQCLGNSRSPALEGLRTRTDSACCCGQRPLLTAFAASWPRQLPCKFSQASIVLDARTEAVHFDPRQVVAVEP